MPLPILIDTDPAMMVRGGLDIDDDLAILFALGSPEIQIQGITATYGNASIGRTYKDACRLLDLAGRQDIPVLKGAGWLTRDINRQTEASRFIVDQVQKSDDGLVLVTLGPLTNLASALRAAPGIAGRIRGHLALGGRLTSGRLEFNFSAHPEATNLVLAAPIPRVIVPIEVCLSVAFTHQELRAIEASPGTVVFPLRDHIRRFMRRKHLLMPMVARIRRSRHTLEGFHPWDVVAMVYLVRPEIFSEVKTLKMWMNGKRVMSTPLDSDSPAEEPLVPHAVDPKAMMELMMDRLLRVKTLP